MLVQLTPDQVTKKWDWIFPAIEAAFPSISRPDEEEVLKSILRGDMQCWVSTRRREGGNVIYAILTTTVVEETNSKTRNLWIYSIYGLRRIPEDEWVNGLEALKKFAKKNGCFKILAYTDVDEVMNLVEKLGGSARRRLLELPLEEIKNGRLI